MEFHSIRISHRCVISRALIRVLSSIRISHSHSPCRKSHHRALQSCRVRHSLAVAPPWPLRFAALHSLSLDASRGLTAHPTTLLRNVSQPHRAMRSSLSKGTVTILTAHAASHFPASRGRRLQQRGRRGDIASRKESGTREHAAGPTFPWESMLVLSPEWSRGNRGLEARP